MDFTERLRVTMEQCLQKFPDGRYYATECGRLRLQQWCDEQGTECVVVIKDGRYELVDADRN